MDNQTIGQQGMSANGQPVFGGSAGGSASGAAGGPPVQPNWQQQPMQVQTRLVPVASQDKTNANRQTVWMIVAIIGGLVAVMFIGLFIWMYSQWSTAKADVDGQIEAAVATAVNEKATELEEQFVEQEKYPYDLFAGPVDYGELSFEYPKTWSVYEAEDASSGGDYAAYLNPDKVYPVNNKNINALRVLIKNQSYDNYIKNYDNRVKDGKLAVSTRMVNGETANVYSGELPDTDKLQGIAVIFKVRDKAVVLQTDAMIFQDDYYKILDSVRFNR